jgi:(p)ppGpp synthase/HD superfamily hydrolase
VDTSNARLISSFSFAESLHRNQKRKATETPYISHLLGVCGLVLEAGGSTDEAIAALLHDSIEDQSDTFPGGREGLRAEICAKFGARVLEIVNACTDDEGHTKGAALTPEGERAAWRKRKEEYLAHLRTLNDTGVLRVSCADKLHNARCLLSDYRREGEKLWERFRTKSRADQIWCYRELANMFLERGAALAGELAWTVDQLEAVARK